MGKVSVVRCEDYSKEKVSESLDLTFSNLGGIERFVNAGDRIFLKLNLISKKKPEEAATTHPAVVEAVAKKLVDKGASVIIGDSPGGPYTKNMLQSLYKVCGIEEAAKNSGAELCYDLEPFEYPHPDGIAVKRLTLVKAMMDCDKIITVSKLKTHGMMMYTGAVKVMFGAVPGMMKAEYHFKMPDIGDFSNMLVDICTYTKPVLSIIDGVTGMEGDGPTAGTPVNSGVILASESPYEADYVGSYLMGINPSDVPTIKRCIERGLLSGELNDIEIAGSLGGLRKKYKIPDTKKISFTAKYLPEWLEKFLDRNLSPKPVFSQKLCIGCQRCRQSCPPGAIKMVNGYPSVDLNKCIKCFCCQELCPQKAVEIKKPWILKKFFR